MKIKKSHLTNSAIALGILAIVLGAYILWEKPISLKGGSVGATGGGDVLSPPGQGASHDELIAYSKLITDNAQPVSTILLGAGCTPTPLVAKLTASSTVTLKNTDSVDHTFVLDADHHYLVPKLSSKTVPADFGHGTGIYGYGCDASPKAVGMLLITL